MKKISRGVAVIKGNTYDLLDIEGVTYALSDINANKLYVEGVFKGRSVWIVEEMVVKGVAAGRFYACNCTEMTRIAGEAKLRKENNAICFKGSGSLQAEKVVVDEFRFRGNCLVKKIEADKVYIVESHNRNEKKSNKKNMSLVDEIVCNKLIADHLKVKKVTAHEVELRGQCEVDILDCEIIKYCEEDCVIRNRSL